jgi:hypothetical protein
LSRNLILLDLLLLALCGLGMWRFSELKRERLAEQEKFLNRREVAAPAPAVLMPPAVTPVAAGLYLEVAQKLLLSGDRNPSVILDVVPPKVMPALPRAYGAMDFGGGPRVVLAAKPGGDQRSYAIGETIGEFKLLAVTQAGVVFEWEGKEVPATYAELRDTVAPVSQQAAASRPAQQAPPHGAASAPPQPPKQSSLQTVGADSNAQGRPGAGSGPTRPCAPGDKAAPGTVSDGYRKMVIDTPMGQGCFWRKVD